MAPIAIRPATGTPAEAGALCHMKDEHAAEPYGDDVARAPDTERAFLPDVAE